MIFENADAWASPVLPDLDHKGFYSLKTGERISYAAWIDMEQQIIDHEALSEYVDNIDENINEVYLLLCKTSETVDMDGFKDYLIKDNCIYETEEMPIWEDEFYRIYRIPV